MANYNFIERKLAKSLSNNPQIKNSIKRIYQYISFFLNKPSKSYSSIVDVVKVGDESVESFFGYYDKNPLNNNLLLFQKTSYDTSVNPSKVISGHGETNVIVRNIIDNKVIFSKSTKAFNWQQGSKLQWITTDSFIYNDISNDGLPCAVFVNLKKSESKYLKSPVYDAFKSEFYLSLDYLPLTDLRPDYAYFKVGGWENIDYKNQSILLSKFNGDEKRIVNLSDINTKYPLHFKCEPSCQKFNHVMISPNGNNFVFLHRAYTNSGKRIDRLFISSLNKNKTDCITTLISDSGMISHYCWIDSSTLLAYMRHNNQDGYFIIDTNNKSDITFAKVDIEGLDSFGDGHPSYIGDGKFITDSYPNKSRMKCLILVDLKSLSFDILGEFLEPLKFNSQTRCDLHPKWDAIKRCIYIDSVHDGKRSLYKVGPIK